SLPAALVRESRARLSWPDREPFGTCILLAGATCAQVVGAVEDIRETRGGRAPRPRFYLPLRQQNARRKFDAPSGSHSAQAVIMLVPPARAVAMAATIKTLIPA